MSGKRRGNCGNCVYVEPNTAAERVGTTGLAAHLCRRHPPTFSPDPLSGHIGVWPVVDDDDWCGEWVAR